MARSKLLMLSVPVMHADQGVPPWYLAGGVSAANCLAAYQAIGAADLAASKVNLVTPGTYNLSAGVDPAFDTAIGWTFNGTDQTLNTGIDPAANATQNMSIIVRYSNCTSAGGFIAGGTNFAGSYFTIAVRTTPLRRYYNGGLFTSAAAFSDNGVICLAGLNGYFNGVVDPAGPLAWSDFDCAQLAIAKVSSSYWAGSIQAVAIYNNVLSAAEALAISNAMAALPFDVSVPAYPGPTAAAAGEFMLVWFGDAHVDNGVLGVSSAQLEQMMLYVKQHANRLGIEAVIFGGDYADSPAHADDRAKFVASMGNIEDIPHLLAIGNHDYDSPGRTATTHNGVFGQSYYTGKSWWSGGFYEAGHSENAYLLLTLDSVDYIIVALELFPRAAVMTWLDGLLTTYAARKAIIITHGCEDSDGTLMTDDDGYGPSTYVAICGADYNSGEGMWNTIKTHDNVILVQSGHVVPPARHAANSDGGQPVNHVLFNVQGLEGLENSLMRFMIFNPTAETIKVETYSSITREKNTAANNQFTLTY
jgi:hypothetical protein